MTPASHPEDTGSQSRRAAASSAKRVLPLDAHVEATDGCWSIQLPVRAEQITVEKQTYVAERVIVRRREAREAVRHDDTVRREELRAVDDMLPRHARRTQRLDRAVKHEAGGES